ncbi:MAG TPA: peptidoglycan DD-metalloendopeptidase family protein [Verrucomicrobiae bacterium]|nr:peptidoglycan DD-metalloendopeptidase family protein [Verrucomicrobiae bacterium]
MLLLLLLFPLLAPAQDRQELESIEAALRASRTQGTKLSAKATALAQEVADLQYQLVARAASARETEAALDQLEAQLADLEKLQSAKRAELAGRRQALVQSLAALERLALTPPGAALVSTAPLDLARGELLLRQAVPELQRRSRRLEADIAALRDLAGEIAARRSKAAALAANLDAERQKITQLLTQKASLQRKTAAQAAASKARTAKLAAEAKDLQDLIDRLARERAATPPPAAPASAVPAPAPAVPATAAPASPALPPAPATAATTTPSLAAPATTAPATTVPAPGAPTLGGQAPSSIRAFPGAPGSLVRPVAGPLVAHFGEVDATGSRAKGILIQTRPGASVLAPYDGQVIYRGPFRSYGEILIIQHGGGYHSVLAGLGRSDAAVGQWVLAGEPVGAMGSPQDGKAQLYVELRRDGHPIDPAPWLGKSDTNVE